MNHNGNNSNDRGCKKEVNNSQGNILTIPDHFLHQIMPTQQGPLLLGTDPQTLLPGNDMRSYRIISRSYLCLLLATAKN